MQFVETLNLGDTNKRLPRDRERNTLKGFMFLDFKTNQDAQRAVDILSSKKIGGARLKARLAEEKM